MTLRIVFRTDASAERGLGHLMRCLALAEALRRRHVEPTFLSVDDPSLAWAERAGFPLVRLKAPEPGGLLGGTAAELERLRPDIVVVDSYDLTGAQRRGLASLALHLVRIDDGRGDADEAEIVVNGNVYGSEASYPHADRRLLGPRYAPLRAAFATPPTTRDRAGVIVTMGGADPPGATLDVLDALASVPASRPLKVLVGPSFKHAARLDAWTRTHPGVAELLRDPPVERLREALGHAKLAVSAGGTTMLELAACGTPAAVLTLADNQVEVARAFEAAGGAVGLGTHASLDPGRLRTTIESLLKDAPRLAAMGHAMRGLVDGQGADRCAQEILEAWAAGDDRVRLRPAGPDDARRVWEWRNDPVTRNQSISTEPVPWETHLPWFQRALEDPKRRLLIIESRNGPLGVLRFDVDASGREAEANINLAPEARGHGFGTLALEKGVDLARTILGVGRVVARIKRENPASQVAFERAGFRKTGDGDVTWWAHETR